MKYMPPLNLPDYISKISEHANVRAGSPADTAIVPAQDLLELGSEARMNLPGSAKGNWGWRLQAGVLTEKLAQRLRSLTMEYGRLIDGDLAPATRCPEDNLTPQIAKRVYELYDRRNRQGIQPDQDGLQRNGK